MTISSPTPGSSQSDLRMGIVAIETVGKALSPAVNGGPEALSAAALKEIRRLQQRRPWQFLLHLFVTWLSIAVAIVIGLYSESWFVSGMLIVFIATRQNVLGVLLHEQVHRNAFHSRFGEWLTNLLVAYPIGLSVEGYRRVHLAHHQCFFTEKDPDYVRKQGKNWTFPQRAERLLKNLLADTLAMNLLATIRSKRNEKCPSRSPMACPRWLQPGLYLIVASGLTAFSGWTGFLLYWVLPWATVLQAIVRWAAICEHKYNLVDPTIAEATPMIHLRWWERMLLPNLNFTTYHIYHHYFPKVAFCDLPKVHAIFQREGLVDSRNVFHGYGDFLRYLLSSSHGSQVAEAGQADFATRAPQRAAKAVICEPVVREEACPTS